jgi:hypothetical protein
MQVLAVKCALGCRWDAGIGLICWRHHDRLADLLNPGNTGTRFDPGRPDDPHVHPSIPVLYGQLTALRGSQGLSPLGPPAFGPASPGDDHVLVLRDPRSRPEQAGPDDVEHAPRPPLVVLAALAARVDRRALDGQQQAGPRQPATVHGVAEWLHSAVGWISGQPWVQEAWTDLRGISGALRAAIGDPPPQSVGTCRAIVDDHGNEDRDGRWRCAVPLYMPERPPRAPDEPIQLPELRCSSCGHRYTGADLVQLGHDQHREQVPA